MSAARHVVVVGGGISGLAAAHWLRESDADVRVSLLEAEPRLGGAIRVKQFAGRPVDVGAEALLAVPGDALSLCQTLGLEELLLRPSRPTSFIWARGALRPLPAGVLSGLPDGVSPIVRSGLLSPAGLARAGLDLVLPAGADDGDRSVGELVGRRLGRQALNHLFDPLLGGIYAGDCDRLSLRATTPQLASLADSDRSLIRALLRRGAAGATRTGLAGGSNGSGRPSPPKGPPLATLPGGLEQLVTALANRHPEVEMRTGAAVESLSRSAGGDYTIGLAGGESLRADAIVLATPAFQSARLLAKLAAGAAELLGAINYVSVATVLLAYQEGEAELPGSGSGFLVPRSDGRLLSACSWSSVKWPHLGEGGTLLRCAIGRAGLEQWQNLDDAQLIERVAAEAAEGIGMRATPTEGHVTRWRQALPQYEVGHLDRIAAIEQTIAGVPGIELAGSAYHGVGIASCVTSGKAAAERVLAQLGARAGDASQPDGTGRSAIDPH